jgi:hypothetical protein
MISSPDFGKTMNTGNAQQYRAGRCVHCLQWSNEINDDHIFPAAWYPDNTPSTVERWTAPSCVGCNTEHGRNEQELLIRLGLCLDPRDARASGVAEKALRSIRPEAGRTPRDKMARQAKRSEILGEIEVYEAPPTAGVFPNFGPDPTIQYPVLAGVKVPADRLIALGQKIVRGLTYHFERRFIECDKEDIQIFFVSDEDATQIMGAARQYGQTFHKGPGIAVTRAVAQDGSDAGLFTIQIWGRLKIYASLCPKEAGPPDSAQNSG